MSSEVQTMFSELDNEITVNKIVKAINQLRKSKNWGPDKLLNGFFSKGTDVLPKHLHKLFNIILAKGYFPSRGAEGYIVPRHKKGPEYLTENYTGLPN